MHGLAIGRQIVDNLHTSGKGCSLPSMNLAYDDPLYDVKELSSIAPIDLKQPFDIRSVIARVVDGSRFDEFKKLYGTVSDHIITFAIFFIFILVLSTLLYGKND